MPFWPFYFFIHYDENRGRGEECTKIFKMLLTLLFLGLICQIHLNHIQTFHFLFLSVGNYVLFRQVKHIDLFPSCRILIKKNIYFEKVLADVS